MTLCFSLVWKCDGSSAASLQCYAQAVITLVHDIGCIISEAIAGAKTKQVFMNGVSEWGM